MPPVKSTGGDDASTILRGKPVMSDQVPVAMVARVTGQFLSKENDMPIGYLDVPPGADLNTKRELVKAMYEALREVYPFPDDHRIFLREWPGDNVSQNGLLGSEPARPVFTVHVPQEMVDRDAKRKMLKKINAAVAAAYQLPDFMIFMVEYPLDLVAHEGGILADDQHRSKTRERPTLSSAASANVIPDAVR